MIGYSEAMATDGKSGPRTIWLLIGQNIERIRKERRLSQDDAAAIVRRGGLPWSRQVVSGLEAGTRELDVGEFVLLCAAFSVTPGEVLHGAEDEWVEVLPRGDDTFVKWEVPGIGKYEIPTTSLGRTMPIGDIRALLAGDRKAREINRKWAEYRQRKDDTVAAVGLAVSASREAEMHAAARLGIDPVDVVKRAHKLWGRSLTEERDNRVARRTDPETSARSLQALRGWITRQLLDELVSREV